MSCRYASFSFSANIFTRFVADRGAFQAKVALLAHLAHLPQVVRRAVPFLSQSYDEHGTYVLWRRSGRSPCSPRRRADRAVVHKAPRSAPSDPTPPWRQFPDRFFSCTSRSSAGERKLVFARAAEPPHDPDRAIGRLRAIAVRRSEKRIERDRAGAYQVLRRFFSRQIARIVQFLIQLAISSGVAADLGLLLCRFIRRRSSLSSGRRRLHSFVCSSDRCASHMANTQLHTIE